MSDRKTISVDAETYDLLKADKTGSWSEYLRELHDGGVNTNECISAGDLDDLAARLEQSIPEVVENRMTRR